jgi:hypothetical protein
MKSFSDGGLIMSERVRTTPKIAEGRREHLSGQVTFWPDKGQAMDAESDTMQPVSVVGKNIIRPMQRVEFDDWEANVMTFMAANGLLDHLTDKEKKKRGLNKNKARRRLTATFCSKTGCIVSLAI